ncbi:MAG: serine/threonine-protein kinase [Labilithrix sp.]
MAIEQPRKIGRYEVERMLGQGGMGRVWLARDTVLGRLVAIKVLRSDLSLPPRVRDELLERMEHEARAAAAVSHPNIVTLHDMGEDPKLGLYLVFEYVTDGSNDLAEKRSLRERLAKGALSFAEVAKLARELGSALTFAHEAGIVHRDVKPENVLFSRTGFKIADFGIARIPESTITRANTVLGTPAYTAPEALADGTFAPASDQFALAATLYEAATARRAFSGDDAITTAGKVSSEPPPPLPTVLGADTVVSALDAALQRGLAKNPAERFASCAELGEEVARVLEASGGPPGMSTRRGGILPLMPRTSLMEQLERTPLSSRAAQRRQVDLPSSSGTGSGPFDTNRPSIIQRKKTQRFQNVAAAAAVIVIITLVLIGRRGKEGEDKGVAGVVSLPETPSAPAPKPSAHPKPKAAPSAKPIADAGAEAD